MSALLTLRDVAEEGNGQAIRKRLRAAKAETDAIKRGMLKLALERNALLAALIAKENGPLVFRMDELAAGQEKAHLIRQRATIHPETGEAFWMILLTSEEAAAAEMAAARMRLGTATETPATPEGKRPDQPPDAAVSPAERTDGEPS